MVNYHIREATEQDCADILQIVTEHAAFEKLDPVPVTANDLKTYGFGEKKFFHTIVAELVEGKGDGKHPLVGELIYHYTFSPFFGRSCTLDHLYVAEEFRGKGIGSALMAKCTQQVLATGCSSMSWVVANWNRGGIDFYNRKGARDVTEQKGLLQYQLDKDAMVKLVADSQQAKDSSP